MENNKGNKKTMAVAINGELCESIEYASLISDEIRFSNGLDILGFLSGLDRNQRDIVREFAKENLILIYLQMKDLGIIERIEEIYLKEFQIE